MRTLVIALFLLGACRGQEQDSGNEAADPAVSGERPSDNAPAAKGGGGSAAPASLTGLWESGSGTRKSQLCMVGEGNKAEFGLVIFGERGNNCSGAGEAVRDGARLTLTMTGDRSCIIEATLAGSALAFPASVPEGCSYYCAPGARLGGARLQRSGSTRADALKAKDFADDPLCG